jgi:ribosomal protein L2
MDMTLEQKIDVVLNHLKLRYELNHLIEEKNKAVRIQDFAAAVKIREAENVKQHEYDENAKALVELINIEQNDKRSVATDDASSKNAD